MTSPLNNKRVFKNVRIVQYFCIDLYEACFRTSTYLGGIGFRVSSLAVLLEERTTRVQPNT